MASISSMDVWLEREVTLPIPPFVGLRLQIDEELEDINELIVVLDKPVKCTRLTEVHAYCSPDTELYFDSNSRSIDVVVAEYEARGWKRSKRES